MIHPFDLAAIFLLIGFGYVGFKRGFLEEIGRLVGLILAGAAAFQFHGTVALFLHSRLPIDGRLISVGTFASVFMGVLLIMRVALRFVQMFLLSRGIRSVNRMMGIAIGAIKASVVAVILCWSVDVLPNADYFREMKMRSYVYQNSSSARRWIVNAFHLQDSFQRGETWVKQRMEDV
ncbi:MAG: CvpA family protein [Candidatus Neomarinimicrobiota bacterium]|nr:CvpA family protein [Candidatus Neomarinimicrobiota bacterium]